MSQSKKEKSYSTTLRLHPMCIPPTPMHTAPKTHSSWPFMCTASSSQGRLCGSGWPLIVREKEKGLVQEGN